MFLAYRQILADPKFYGGLLYSFTVGVITIIVSLAFIVPTAYWVRLRVPRLRPFVEFVTLMPFVIPPVVLVFGLIRVVQREPLRATDTNFGSDVLLVVRLRVLSFPYMYRAVDTGLRRIDVRTLTEAAQSLGAGWLADPRSGSSSRTSGSRSCRRVPDARHRHRRVHDRQLPRPERRSGRTCRCSARTSPTSRRPSR